uniref:Guanylate-binding protein N-terminal domain-containing protein n=1 Tax=Alexandrium monilatum TaxID=311494 RepID=A0A7S4Q362_9DINO
MTERSSLVQTPPRVVSPLAQRGTPSSIWGTPLESCSLTAPLAPRGLPSPMSSQPSVPNEAVTTSRGPCTCVPLLKFSSDAELPHLEPEGLATLAALPPPVSVVTFLGDGRCGKSTLASRLVTGDSGLIFPVGDTGEPVTAGIDLCVVPSWSEGSLVVFDCEGGNNPAGAIRSAVDLVAMLGSTLTVQVVWGQMGEGQLQQIGQALAARDRLMTGSNAGQPAQRLLLVVNGCHLRYSPSHLAKAFLEVHTGSESARSELRANIKRAYEHIRFVTVPLEMDLTFNEKVSEFEQAVREHCSPVELAGSRLSGAQVVEMLRSAVGELKNTGAVPVPSVFRHVIYDHLLMPLVTRLTAEVETSMPDLDDGEYRPLVLDCRADTLESFDRDSCHLTYAELVAEARRELRDRIDRIWLNFAARNEAIGEQDRDVTTEFDTRYSHSEERVVAWRRPCIVMGKKKPVVQACNVFRVWTRTRVLKKNGRVAYSEWMPNSTVESAGSLDADCLNRSTGSCSAARPLSAPRSEGGGECPRSASAPPSLDRGPSE